MTEEDLDFLDGLVEEDEEAYDADDDEPEYDDDEPESYGDPTDVPPF